ncbi:hypothetical protein ACIRUY_17845 [Streptomyces erythrochromogenes]|uniref:hypothetical protein n=1 Tax=Streptomyces erythrochromogenes TaxID=285574 RepID=UPI00382F465F
MPGKDETPSDESEDVEPNPGGEGSPTTRLLLVGVVSAFLAGLADEAAHWFIQFVVWLYEFLVSRL